MPPLGRGERKVQRVIDSYNGVPCTYVRPAHAPVRPGEVCGQIHLTCRAHAKDNSLDGKSVGPRCGDPCGAYAKPGLLICTYHGANTPQARAAGERNVARERALGEVGALLTEALGIMEATPGAEQMLMGINHAGAMALSYRWLLDELPVKSEWSFQEVTDDKGAMTRFVNVQTEGLVGPNHQGVQQLHAYEEGFRYWTALHGRLLKAAHDAGLDERRQRFQEEQVRAVGTAVRSIVEGLGHALDDPTVVPVVEQALRVLTTEAAG